MKEDYHRKFLPTREWPVNWLFSFQHLLCIPTPSLKNTSIINLSLAMEACQFVTPVAFCPGWPSGRILAHRS